MKLDPFIEAEKIAGRSVKRACDLFEVSRAALYQRLNPTPSARAVADGELSAKITEIHADSAGTYGSPRVHAELGHQGVPVGRRRVARLMQAAGIEGRATKRWRRTTIADPAAEAARDRIARQFDPGGDWACSGLTDIHHQGFCPGEDAHRGDEGTDQAPCPSVSPGARRSCSR